MTLGICNFSSELKNGREFSVIQLLRRKSDKPSKSHAQKLETKKNNIFVCKNTQKIHMC